MSAFIAAALAFPTVVFTVLLLFFLAYALLVVFGALSIDALDGVLGADDIPDNGLLDGALDAFGVQGIPLTIFGGVSTLFAWFASFVGMRFLGGFMPEGALGMTLQGLLGFVALLVGLFVGSRAVRPLRPVFVTAVGPGRASLVGKVCTIRSLRVDEQTGTAEVEDGGAGFIAEVRCLRDNELTRGSRAIVYDYDPEEGIYRVGPLDRALAESPKA
ncbi:MAG TPA: hypothetical protein VF618_11250 [Thermoanaerobaculia bacterium]